MDKNKIVTIEGEKFYVLSEHSYVSWCYEQTRDGVSFNYSYIRLPVEGDTTVYEDRYVTHVWLRDDVNISLHPDGSVQASWDYGCGSPFFNIHTYNAEKRRREREKELFFELLQEEGRELDKNKVSVKFKDGNIIIKQLESGQTQTFYGPFSAYNYIAGKKLYKIDPQP